MCGSQCTTTPPDALGDSDCTIQDALGFLEAADLDLSILLGKVEGLIYKRGTQTLDFCEMSEKKFYIGFSKGIGQS